MNIRKKPLYVQMSQEDYGAEIVNILSSWMGSKEVIRAGLTNFILDIVGKHTFTLIVVDSVDKFQHLNLSPNFAAGIVKDVLRDTYGQFLQKMTQNQVRH